MSHAKTKQAKLPKYYTQIEYECGIYYGIDLGKYQQATAHAKKLAQEMGSLRGSIENGDGNYAGLVAELVMGEIIDSKRDATYNYDLFVELYNGVKIDVKTKRRTVPPKSHYEVSIADWNTSQDCDWYYFTSFNEENSVLWFLGYMEPDRYYDAATFHKEGDKDPDNNFTFKADCYNVAFSELKQPKRLVDELAPEATAVKT